MGCFHSNQGKTNLPSSRAHNQWVDSPVGKLILQIKHISLHKIQQKQAKKSDILFKIKFSNQDQHLKYHQIENDSPKITFAVNSCYRNRGRFLLLEVWNLKTQTENDNALGFLDLKHIVPQRQQDQLGCKKVIKTYLNYRKQPGGFIQLSVEFLPIEYSPLLLKINSAFLQKKVEGKKFTTKVTIGEEVFQTSLIMANKRNQVLFNNQIFKFRVPEFIKSGKLKLIEKMGSSDIFWGQYTINLEEFLNQTICDQVEVDDELHADYGICGKIRFSSKNGNQNNANFKEINSPLRKKSCDDVQSTKDQYELYGKNDFDKVTYRVYRAPRSESLPPLDVGKAVQKLQRIRKKQSLKTP